MSKKKSVAPFIKIPNERNPALLSVSIFCRGLAMELFMHSCVYSDSGYDPSPIPVYGNWHVCIAKLLQVDSAERGNLARMLDRLVAVGVIVVEDGFIHVRYSAPKWEQRTPPPEPRPTKVRDESDASPQPVRHESDLGPVHVRRDLTPHNDSTLDLQRREEKIENRQEGDARAREGRSDFSIGSDLMLSATGRFYGEEWRHQLERIGMKPDAERRAVLAAIQADPWCKANVRVDPGHVLKQWPKYAAGNPPLKAAVRAAVGGSKYAGPSAVAEREDYAVKGEIKW